MMAHVAGRRFADVPTGSSSSADGGGGGSAGARIEEITDMGERYVVDMTTGEKYIRGSRRADGTYRKDIRVRSGYVPLEEQRTFQTRQQLSRAQRSNQYPGGVIGGGGLSTTQTFPPGYSGVPAVHAGTSRKSSGRSGASGTPNHVGPRDGGGRTSTTTNTGSPSCKLVAAEAAARGGSSEQKREKKTQGSGGEERTDMGSQQQQQQQKKKSDARQKQQQSRTPPAAASAASAAGSVADGLSVETQDHLVTAAFEQKLRLSGGNKGAVRHVQGKKREESEGDLMKFVTAKEENEGEEKGKEEEEGQDGNANTNALSCGNANTTPPKTPDELRKRIRNVKKKLNEVEALRTKLESGASLSGEQLRKVQRMDALKQELEVLTETLRKTEGNSEDGHVSVRRG